MLRIIPTSASVALFVSLVACGGGGGLDPNIPASARVNCTTGTNSINCNVAPSGTGSTTTSSPNGAPLGNSSNTGTTTAAK